MPIECLFIACVFVLAMAPQLDRMAKVSMSYDKESHRLHHDWHGESTVDCELLGRRHADEEAPVEAGGDFNGEARSLSAPPHPHFLKPIIVFTANAGTSNKETHDFLRVLSARPLAEEQSEPQETPCPTLTTAGRSRNGTHQLPSGAIPPSSGFDDVARAALSFHNNIHSNSNNKGNERDNAVGEEVRRGGGTARVIRPSPVKTTTAAQAAQLVVAAPKARTVARSIEEEEGEAKQPWCEEVSAQAQQERKTKQKIRKGQRQRQNLQCAFPERNARMPPTSGRASVEGEHENHHQHENAPHVRRENNNRTPTRIPRMAGRSMDEETPSMPPTSLFERLVTEEVQEIKAYARIVENQNRRLAELERAHGDLESRLQLESRSRQQLETTLEIREREWANQLEQLESDRDHWRDLVKTEENKNTRLMEEIMRKEQEIRRMIQRKVCFNLSRSVLATKMYHQLMSVCVCCFLSRAYPALFTL